MKKRIFFVFMFFISHSCFAQDQKDTTAKKESKWSIMIGGGPNYSYRDVTASVSIAGRTPSIFNNIEEPYYGLELGMEMIRKINNHFSLLFGFSYCQYVYRSIKLDTLLWNYYDNNPNGGPSPSGVNAYSQLYQLNSSYYINECFYNVPIAIRYTLWDEHRVSFVADVGVSLGFLSETFFIQDQNGIIYRVSPVTFDLNSFFFLVTPFSKLGALFKISHRTSILLQPGFIYDIRAIGVLYPLSKHIYSADITMSLVCKLK